MQVGKFLKLSVINTQISIIPMDVCLTNKYAYKYCISVLNDWL